MSTGFAGRPAMNYVAAVVDAILTAEIALRSDPFQGLSNLAVPPPNIPTSAPVRPPYEESDVQDGSGPTGIGSSNNILLPQEGYDNDVQSLYSAIDNFGSYIHRTIGEIEELLNSSFQLPQVVPLIMVTLVSYRSILGNFSELTHSTLV